MPTRRKFLVNCSVVALATSVTPASVFAGPLRFREVPLEQISFSAFATRLNAYFQVQGDASTVTNLQLVQVQPSPAGPVMAEDAANEKFSLLFRGRSGLEQGTYWFELAGLGRFALFIVPAGTDEAGSHYYQAIFNRPTGGPLPRAGEGNIPVGNPRNQRRQPTPFISK
jgi:hypothetical protein